MHHKPQLNAVETVDSWFVFRSMSVHVRACFCVALLIFLGVGVSYYVVSISIWIQGSCHLRSLGLKVRIQNCPIKRLESWLGFHAIYHVVPTPLASYPNAPLLEVNLCLVVKIRIKHKNRQPFSRPKLHVTVDMLFMSSFHLFLRNFATFRRGYGCASHISQTIRIFESYLASCLMVPSLVEFTIAVNSDQMLRSQNLLAMLLNDWK